MVENKNKPENSDKSIPRNREFKGWLTSVYGEYLKFLMEKKERFVKGNIVFFDIEFFPKRTGRKPRLKVAVWYESRPTKGHRKHNLAWFDDKSGIERFLQSLYRADYIIGYHVRGLDYPSLEFHGLDQCDVLPKSVDLYDGLFAKLSLCGHGSLNSVSRLNGGPEKVIRKDNSREEIQRQCQGDVKMLQFIFRKVLSGHLKTSRFGELDFFRIWPELVPEEERQMELPISIRYLERFIESDPFLNRLMSSGKDIPDDFTSGGWEF